MTGEFHCLFPQGFDGSYWQALAFQAVGNIRAQDSRNAVIGYQHVHGFAGVTWWLPGPGAWAGVPGAGAW